MEKKVSDQADYNDIVSHLKIIRTWAEVDRKYGGIMPDCCEHIVTWIDDALELLKEQKSEWLEDSDPGQEYGTTWACRKCMHSIHKPYIWNPYDSGYKYCLFCGRKMVVKLDD